MTIDLYSFHMSPFCRSVLATFKELGVDYNLKNIDLIEKQQFSEEFLKINPQHLIPTIVDDGFKLWESRAVMQYLCNKYAPESTLYPKEPKKRAIVDRWLNFDITLLGSAKYLLMKQFLGIDPPEDKIVAFKNNLKIADQLIGDNKYLTGDHLTIADLSVIANTLFLSMTPSIDLSEFPNFKRWQTTLITTLPYFNEIFMSATMEEMMGFVAKSQEYLKRKLNEF